MRQSLRWQIAGWYSLLLLAVIIGVVALITAQFQRILYVEAKTRLDETVADIQRSSVPPRGRFALAGSSQLLALANPDNLERWASLETFVQVDDASGRPLAKSFNMGSDFFPSAGSLGAAHPASLQTITFEGIPYLLESRFLRSGNVSLIVQIGEPLDEVIAALTQTRRAILFILGVAALVAFLLSFAMARRITTAINQLTRAMRETDPDLLDNPLHWKGRKDEIGRLAEAFDDLIARLRDAFQRERQFIADASHEIRTPLTSINANAMMLTRWAGQDERVRQESLQTIVQETASLAETVDRMLTLARADAGEMIIREPVSLVAVATSAVDEARARAAAKGLSLTLETNGAIPPVHGDEALIRQMFRNLLDNAIKFTPAGKVITRISSDDRQATVEIEDTGPGIPASETPFVFDRFYRSDRSRSRDRSGTGLGLSIVRSIARVHGGTIEVERVASGGALFRIRFPSGDS